jgi:hypothetical protein
MHPTRIFKTPEDLLKAWGEYKQSLKEQAKEWPKIQYVGKDGNRVTDYPVIPFTLEGFKRYCRENHGDIHHYFESKDSYYDEFRGICSHIKEEIREQQIIGGMLGFYNPSITQRLNGLKEQSETEIKGTLNIPRVPDIGDRK